MDVDNDVVLHYHNFDEFSITRKLSERLVVIGGASVYGQLFDVEERTVGWGFDPITTGECSRSGITFSIVKYFKEI